MKASQAQEVIIMVLEAIVITEMIGSTTITTIIKIEVDVVGIKDMTTTETVVTITTTTEDPITITGV